MLETFTCAAFQAHLGQAFGLRVDDAGVDVVLTEATELPMAAPQGGRAPFSLVFRGPSGVVFPQRIYRVEHHDIGAFDLFLVPIAADAEGTRYEAVFT